MTLRHGLLGGIALVLAAGAADWETEGFITPPGESPFELGGTVDGTGNSFFVWNGPARTAPGPGPSPSDFRYWPRSRGGPLGDIRPLPANNEEPVNLAGAANGDVVMGWRERPDPQSFALPPPSSRPRFALPGAASAARRPSWTAERRARSAGSTPRSPPAARRSWPSA